ncbi:40S ribosomal protein S20 [Fusarium oxysporum]|nr:40S ribosomal protein S20 [Fusarium oxysporum]
MSHQKNEKDVGDAPKSHRIRITLTSRKVQSLEKVSAELIERARSKGLTIKGPVRLPTKNLKITTRKTPCGEGSKTWDSYELRVHKRLIDLHAPTEVVKSVIVNSKGSRRLKRSGQSLTVLQSRPVSRLRSPSLLKRGH